MPADPITDEQLEDVGHEAGRGGDTMDWQTCIYICFAMALPVVIFAVVKP